jgi:desulfoferrodoxin (superoxide reductase-like protein)
VLVLLYVSQATKKPTKFQRRSANQEAIEKHRMKAMGLFPLVVCTASTGAFQVMDILSRGAADTLRESMHTSYVAEVSRRVALITAASFAAGVGPVQATDIAKTARKIEKELAGKANSNGAPEKHLPKVTISDTGTVEIVVPHVMDPVKPHFIELVWLKNMQSDKIVAAKAFSASDTSPPTLITASVPKGVELKAMLFCNLHGLWEGDSFSV